jgi:DMSO/TMAO reductase YedYZ molybdopterin-dependent catalytic subunit
MERRIFLIGAVAGGIGVVECAYVSGWMKKLQPRRGFSVKDYEKYGEKAALIAITPNQDFYLMLKGTTPVIKRSDWRLKIDGLVEHPLTLTYEDLLRFPVVEKFLTLECISNPIGGSLIGNAKWTGTPFRALLDRVKPAPEAKYAAIYAADGLSSGHPIARMWNEENFIAYRMNGEDLPPNHGYPARLFIPGKFGMKQPKWITRVQFVDEAYLGYWERQGWSDDCERHAHARFTDLQSGAKISGPNFELSGYANGNLDGIKAVELSFDLGTSWKPATLFSHPSPLVWTFWKYLWISPARGKYEIRVRAIDDKGRVQSWGPRDIYPDGATGQQVMKVEVV